MQQPLPKKWTRRVLAIRIGATLLGGAVLIVLFALLAMLYWMNAKAPILMPGKMIAPDASAWVRLDFAAAPTRTVPAEVIPAATQGMPEQAAKLVQKGLHDPSCHVRIVFSRTSAGEKAMGVNLGKYPGMFRLVRRDLERRSEKRLLPYAIKYHSGAPMFFTEGMESSSLTPIAIKDTVIVQAANTSELERFLDVINDPREEQRAYIGSCQFDAQSWLLLTQLAGDVGPMWKETAERMGKELPVLNRLEGIYCFSGAALGGRLELVAASLEDAAEAAREVPDWIRKNPQIGSTTLAVVSVTTREKEVMINFSAPGAPAPAIPVPY